MVQNQPETVYHYHIVCWMLDVYFLKYFIAFFLLFIASLSHGKYKIGNYSTMRRNEKKKRNPAKEKTTNYYEQKSSVSEYKPNRKKERIFSTFFLHSHSVFSIFIRWLTQSSTKHTHTHSLCIFFCAFCMSMLFHISKTNKKRRLFQLRWLFRLALMYERAGKIVKPNCN